MHDPIENAEQALKLLRRAQEAKDTSYRLKAALNDPKNIAGRGEQLRFWALVLDLRYADLAKAFNVKDNDVIDWMQGMPEFDYLSWLIVGACETVESALAFRLSLNEPNVWYSVGRAFAFHPVGRPNERTFLPEGFETALVVSRHLNQKK